MKAFISYCHFDEEKYQLKTSFRKALTQLVSNFGLELWDDGLILAGRKWEDTIEKNIQDSYFFFPLISQDYIASDACQKELNEAKKLNKYIVPIITRACDWKHLLGEYQALPKDAKPVMKWGDQDEAWLDICNQIKIILENLIVVPDGLFLSEIEKIDFVSPNKSQLSLSDTYIWPSVSTVSSKGNAKTIELSFQDIILGKNSKIIGDQLSGKTSLLKALFIESIKNGYSPLFVRGIELRNKTKQFSDVIERAIRQQYEKPNFQQKEKNILLIDDYDHLIRSEFMSYAQSFFSVIVVSCSSEENIMYFNTAPLFSQFADYQLEPFYAKKRYELISKWKTEKLDQTSEEMEINQLEIDNLCSEVAQIIGKQIVPSYPFHVLSILQAKEVLPNDFSFSAYGHCYHGLIIAILLRKGINGNEIDSCINYLTVFSRFVFDKGAINNWVITSDEYEEFKDKYLDKYLIEDRLINYLDDQAFRIIRLDKGMVSFDKPYLFYYFLGKWFSENYDEQEVSSLCERIYLKDYSEILIFIIHHSTNKELIKTIELHCMCSYDKFAPVKLTREETAFMSDLMESIPKQIESKLSEEENKNQILQDNDRNERNALNQKEKIEDYEDEDFRALVVGFRLLDVIGQILKNRIGSIDKGTVGEVLFEVEQLGLRILSYSLNTINSDKFLDWLISRIKSQNEGKSLSEEVVEKIARKNVAAFCNANIIMMLGRISGSVSSRLLLPLQRKLATDENGPAYEFLYLIQKLSFEGLVDMEYIMNLLKKYRDNKDLWAETVLGLIVQSYLHYYRVSEKTKQKICSIFGWDIKKLASSH